MQNRTRILAGIVALSSIMVGCTKKEANPAAAESAAMATPAAATTDHSADAAAIVSLDSAWMQNVMAKNVDSLMIYYAPDAVSYGYGAAPASGIDQIRALYTEMVKSTFSNPKIPSSTVKFSDDGMMAFDHGTYQMTVQPPGGKASTETGGYLNVWKKMDGQWKLVAEMSTPVPPPKM